MHRTLRIHHFSSLLGDVLNYFCFNILFLSQKTKPKRWFQHEQLRQIDWIFESIFLFEFSMWRHTFYDEDFWMLFAIKRTKSWTFQRFSQKLLSPSGFSFCTLRVFVFASSKLCMTGPINQLSQLKSIKEYDTNTYWVLTVVLFYGTRFFLASILLSGA